ncbi:MAG: ATP-binding protein [bacterium]
MKEIVVISGKGGTGKTTLCAALANIAGFSKKVVLADCDVDASNLPVLLDPEVKKQEDCIASARAVKTAECLECGRCSEVCRFNAISPRGIVDDIKCEGCGSCVYVCPDNVLELQEEITGTIFTSETRLGPLVHAELKRGEEASGKLVIKIKELLKTYSDSYDLAFIDGSPGTGCPVIASLRGADIAFVVTEPTVSGLHDLKRVLEVADSLGVPAHVCVNKADINEQMCQKIKSYCENNGYPFIGRLPYDESVIEALKKRRTIVENNNEVLTEKMQQILNKLLGS